MGKVNLDSILNAKQIDIKATKNKSKQLLSCYRRLAPEREYEEIINLIDKTIGLLEEAEQEVLIKKYTTKYKRSDIAIYASLYMSESIFYKNLEKALLSFARNFNEQELLVYREGDHESG